MKSVLLLGASGHIAPHIIPGLERYYDLRLADLKPHPGGKPTMKVDITDYNQVREAARGVEAIMNWSVLRDHPAHSFSVSTRGAYHVMKAAAELGISNVLQTGPEMVVEWYRHEFDVGEVPEAPGTGYYRITKYLGLEISRVYARTYGIRTVFFKFNNLFPKPTAPVSGEDFRPFNIVFEDLVEACRLAIEIEFLPDNFQALNMTSYTAQGKYTIDTAHRILGYEPQERYEDYYTRSKVQGRRRKT
jgi:nucleoside-diphosphate-sugar epimerase